MAKNIINNLTNKLNLNNDKSDNIENEPLVESKMSRNSYQKNLYDQTDDDFIVLREFSAKNENQAMIWQIRFDVLMDIILEHNKLLELLIN